MSGEFLQAHAAQQASGPDGGLSGVMIGRVIENCDLKRCGRVKVRLAARGGLELWARTATLDTGAYFLPQVDDEVLVAFHQGDGNEAFVIGRLWNDNRRPPREGPQDPDQTRVIRTPSGHEIEFDETQKSVTIKTAAGQRIEMKPAGVTVSADEQGLNKVKLDSAGNVRIEAAASITLKAPRITLDATNLVLGDASSASITIG